jgi:hypothetical protein
VLEPGGEADLALEAGGADGGGELGMEELESDGAVVSEVARESDRGHPAAPELALEGVAAGQLGPPGVGRMGHGSLAARKWDGAPTIASAPGPGQTAGPGPFLLDTHPSGAKTGTSP